MNVEVGVGLAFVAGLASFLAPCVLPLVPAYLSYLSGYALTRPEDRTWRDRVFVVAHAIAFVAGFTLVFVLLGTAAGSLGRLLRGDWLRYIGGVIVILFGLTLLGLLQLPFLGQEARLRWQGRREWGFLSSVLVGMVFAAGWSPCIGPALASILVLSADHGNVIQGAVLLTAYAGGIGIPFILAAMVIDRLATLIHRAQRFLPVAQKVAGALLIAAGIVIVTGGFATLGQWLEQRGIGWDLNL